ncbi:MULTISPECIES: alpha/beta fold hydrolase [Klebsiella/Raoultella group]|uniref:alpha/beta fold hydrolase n=1 Tax=Klebsiella/Raoultella group TaxID=2890311 RepID=UPI0015A7517D|nr:MULTISPECIES: alpha/beta fold hydrolase [Klebsiella/Raoultella group]QLK20884.1 alpha/beta fold hydrolase [Raoultella ornithinolytica]
MASKYSDKFSKKISAEEAQLQLKKEASYSGSTPLPLRLPEEFTHHDVQLAGLKNYYLREGYGPALILWHGWLGFWWDWQYIFEPLAEHFDVIVPDFRGDGDTEKTNLHDVSKYAADQPMDDQAALMEALGISEAYILAHDYGSMTTHKFLRKYADKIIKAMIIDPVTPSYSVT